ncbi:MAG: hypothetical protein ACLT69_13670 [Intestinibacter bartlettii]
MAGINFSLEYEDVQKIQQAIGNYEDKAEDVINKYMHGEGKDKNKSIHNCIPVSDRNKKHARDADSLTNKNFNLGIRITTKQKYNYLVFPMTASGTSQGKSEKLFMEEGVKKVKDNVVNEILDKLREVNI